MATRLQELRRRVSDGAALVRCDGTASEVADYRQGVEKPGWKVSPSCRSGDVLVDTQGRGTHRLIIAVTPVESLKSNGDVVWANGDDTPIFPAAEWSGVMKRAGLVQLWPRLVGAPALDFLSGLSDILGERPRVSVVEGRRYLRVCRRRSKALRDAALEEQQGKCEACGLQPRADFGPDGDRAIDVHHKVPLSISGEVNSSLEDVYVVCASCHRLLHTENPPLPVEAIAHRGRRSSTAPRARVRS